MGNHPVFLCQKIKKSYIHHKIAPARAQYINICPVNGGILLIEKHMTLLHLFAIKGGMQMNLQNLNEVQNYDFLAQSFAHMYATGHTIDIETITGNMPEEVRKWFLERYEHYCKQALSEGVPEAH